jgi:parallel beta-helix repeat protein
MRQKRLCATSVVLALALALLPPAALPAKAAGTYTVTMAADRDQPWLCIDGHTGPPPVGCSLREALTNANSDPGSTINFDISGCAGGVCTLTPSSSLPALSGGSTTIDGTTDPSGDIIEINCSNSNAACLQINSANNTIRELVVNRCPYAGIIISGAGADYNEILGCYIGTDASGELGDRGNDASGVVITNGAHHNQIGAPGERNVISANGDDGVWISGESTDYNSVTHNYIGTNASGTTDLGNHGDGIYIFNHADHNVIGSTPGGHNVISGNNGYGVRVSDADDNQLVVNYIGTNAAGQQALGNGLWGLSLQRASSNQVGSVEEVTIISSNGGGILITGTVAVSNTIIHSYIGTNLDGDTDRGNLGDGVQISNGAHGNTIGGDTVEEKNVISSNEGYGVSINDADNNTVSGNYIGTNEFGAGASLGNLYAGVQIADGSTNNTIGGDTAGEKNVVSDNGAGGSWYDGIEISGSNANTVQGNYIGLRADGLSALGNPDDGVAVSGDSNVVKGNVISGNNGRGLYINGSNTQATGNIIGLRASGNFKVPNGECGIYVNSGNGTVIGGQASGDYNTIAGNVGHGVVISPTTGTISGTVIMGNYIGTNQLNSSSVGNGGVGVYLYGQYGQVQYSTIGGDEAGEENVISGNGDSGIILEGTGTRHNVVSRNYIGLNSSGSSKLSNGQHGVEIRIGASYNTVGGGGANRRNYIGGNQDGVVIYDHSGLNRTHHNQVTGNYIGTDSTGTASLGNTTGVAVRDNAQTNTVADNLISGNAQHGVCISGDSTYDNVVQGNYIGINASGAGSLANGGSGVYIGGSVWNNRIGGTTAAERNLISGNSGYGIWITGSNTRSNNVWGNYIGVNVNGTAAIGNADAGVFLEFGTRSNNIGGTGSGEGNVIAGNGGQGIYVTAANWNTIRGNTIGTNTGGADLGNTLHGIYLDGGAHTNGIGPGNVIAFNDSDGVRVDGSTTLYNTITATQIYSNTLLGIENINGGNMELPPPIIAGTSPITGTTCANCVVQIFSDYEDEGRIYHGFAAADATGNFAYSGSVSGPYVTATATDGSGSTSEFSSPIEAGEGGPGSGDIYLPIITKNYP